MKLFRIPWPWDYHCAGALIVASDTKESALETGRTYYAMHKSDHSGEPEWNSIEELSGLVTEDFGCDC